MNTFKNQNAHNKSQSSQFYEHSHPVHYRNPKQIRDSIMNSREEEFSTSYLDQNIREFKIQLQNYCKQKPNTSCQFIFSTQSSNQDEQKSIDDVNEFKLEINNKNIIKYMKETSLPCIYEDYGEFSSQRKLSNDNYLILQKSQYQLESKQFKSSQQGYGMSKSIYTYDSNKQINVSPFQMIADESRSNPAQSISKKPEQNIGEQNKIQKIQNIQKLTRKEYFSKWNNRTVQQNLYKKLTIHILVNQKDYSEKKSALIKILKQNKYQIFL